MVSSSSRAWSWRHILASGLCAVVVVGCASQAYDPVPSSRQQLLERRFDSPLDQESSYRRLYRRLEDCVGFGYHVQPRFERDTGRAWVMVVSGLGLNRYSFLGNQFEARFDVLPASGGSQVLVTWTDPSLTPLIDAVPAWLNSTAGGCRP